MFYKFLILLLFMLSLPLQFVIAIAIFITSDLPIVYKQKRVGKGGNTFSLYKFRTVVTGADRIQKKYQKDNQADGPVFKIHNDPRFTTAGKFLSHTGLDELPQLVNVLKGDMALIGPRPLPVDEAKKLKVWQQSRHRVLPGIISPWIVHGYHSTSFDEWMKSDIVYTKHKNFAYDIVLFLKTIRVVVGFMLKELSIS